MQICARVILLSICLLLASSVCWAEVAGRRLTLEDAIETTRFMVADDHATSFSTSPDGKKYVAMLLRGNVAQDGIEVEVVCGSLLSIEDAVPYSVVKLFSRALGGIVGREGGAAELMLPTRNFPVWIDNDRVAFLWLDGTGVRQVVAANVVARSWEYLTESPTDVANFAFGGDMLVYEARTVYSPERSNELWKSGFAVSSRDAYALALGAADGATIRDLLWGNGERFVQKVGRLKKWPAKRIRVIHGGLNTYQLHWPSIRPSVSGDGAFAIVPGTPPDVPDEWSQYEGSALHDMLRARSAGDTHRSRNLQQLFVVSLVNSTARPLLNAPLNPLHLMRAGISWAPDNRSALIWPIYSPGSSADDPGRLGDAMVEVNVATGRFISLPTSREEALDAREVRWISQDLISIQLSSGAQFLLKRKGAWHRTSASLGKPIEAPLRMALHQDENTPPALYAYESGSDEAKLVFDPNPELKSRFSLGRVEFVKWADSTEGKEREGRLFYPVGYVEGVRYPLVIQTHSWGRKEDFTLNGKGSPFPTLGPAPSTYMAQPLANSGFFVIQIRPGLTDPAAGFPAEAKAQMRGFESAARYLSAQGKVDPARVGLMGHSRSGWHVQYTLAFSEYPFAAALVDDNIDAGYFEAGLMGWGDAYLLNGARPFGQGLGAYLENSPAFNIEHIRAPLLMMVTDSFVGRAAPVMTGWEFFSRLRHLDRPVEYFVIPDIDRGGHNIQNPRQLLAQQRRAMDWWNFWLRRERDTAPSKQVQYKRWNELRELRDKLTVQPRPPRFRWTAEPLSQS